MKKMFDTYMSLQRFGQSGSLNRATPTVQLKSGRPARIYTLPIESKFQLQPHVQNWPAHPAAPLKPQTPHTALLEEI